MEKLDIFKYDLGDIVNDSTGISWVLDINPDSGEKMFIKMTDLKDEEILQEYVLSEKEIIDKPEIVQNVKKKAFKSLQTKYSKKCSNVTQLPDILKAEEYNDPPPTPQIQPTPQLLPPPQLPPPPVPIKDTPPLLPPKDQQPSQTPPKKYKVKLIKPPIELVEKKKICVALKKVKIDT